MWQVQLFELYYDDKEQEAVNKVLESRWLSMGQEVNKFENNFSKFLGEESSCFAVSSCTAALHTSLMALGIRKDDEVIMPSLTFVADANVIEMVGAKPVLADSRSLDDWNVSFESVKEKITDRTKAVIVVHYAGYPCKDIRLIHELCKKEGIALIEDAAHAPGASIEGRMCGTWGDLSAFSFFSNKNLSIGEGGMISTIDDNLKNRIQHLRSHGMTTLTLDKHKGRELSYDVIIPGLNYRMDEIRAALGVVQLNKLADGNKKRFKATEKYRRELRDSSILIPFEDIPKTSVSSYHILPVLLPDGHDRAYVINYLKERGIQSSIHYPPFWNFKAYKGRFSASDYPISSKICTNQLSLPLFPSISVEQIELVTATLLEAIDD